ncbi:MAG: hypothetical protein FWC16_02890 [Defluviitaleaceae bacterium]|nr:hypothetical protein [Defluviitaleaceae bacterium]MCL2273847.1 hypothetical protein [Defluviitaleaceae bacterium]
MLTKLCFIAVMLLVLSACGRQTSLAHEATLEDAIQAGYIVRFDHEMVQPTTDVAQARYRTLSQSTIHILTPTYITQRDLFFTATDRPLAAMHVERGTRVQAGDVLAELEPLDPEEAERLFIRQQNARIELERFEREFTAERDRQLGELEETRLTVNAASDDEWYALALDFTRREIQHEQFLINHTQTREGLTRNLQDINEQIAGDQILAPFDGVVMFHNPLATGEMVRGWPRMVTLAGEKSLFLVPNERATVFRYGDVLPAIMFIPPDIRIPFYAQVVNDAWSTGNRNNMTYLLAPLDWDILHTALYEHEADIAMPAPPSFIAETRLSVTVLSVPDAAIFTLNDRHFVYIYERGYRRRQDVIIGIRANCTETGEPRREILDGLHTGQQVVIPQ